MADPFTAEREAIAARLTAAGVERVALDRGQAPPFVVVGVPTGTGEPIGLGAWRAEYPVHVVYLAPGDRTAAGWGLEQVTAALGALGLAAFRPVTYGDDQLPAFQLVVRRDVPNPNC